MVKRMIKRFFEYISNRPLLFGFGGTGTSVGLDFVHGLDRTAELLKDIGIIAGAFLSMFSLIVYVNRNFSFSKNFPFIKIIKK